jgi:hypothetical protein
VSKNHNKIQTIAYIAMTILQNLLNSIRPARNKRLPNKTRQTRQATQKDAKILVKRDGSPITEKQTRKETEPTAGIIRSGRSAKKPVNFFISKPPFWFLDF